MAIFFAILGAIILVVGAFLLIGGMLEDEDGVAICGFVLLILGIVMLVVAVVNIESDEPEQTEPKVQVEETIILEKSPEIVQRMLCEVEESETDNVGRIRHNCISRDTGRPSMVYCHVVDMSGDWDNYSCDTGLRVTNLQCKVGPPEGDVPKKYAMLNEYICR